MHIIIARAAALATLTLAASGCGAASSSPAPLRPAPLRPAPLQAADPTLEATCTPEPNAPPRCVQGSNVPVAPVADGQACGAARRWVAASEGVYVCKVPPPLSPEAPAAQRAPDPTGEDVVCYPDGCLQSGQAVTSPAQLPRNVCGPGLSKSWHPLRIVNSVDWVCK